MPSVSVIIPTYNHAGYVINTLASVLRQTYRDYEVIVVNDGSPDDTAQVLRPSIDSGQIRYFEQPNAGQAAARNRGLEEARGELIAYLDDDDLWPLDKLQWQVDVLAHQSEIDLVGGDVSYDMEITEHTRGSGPSLLISGIDVFWGCPFTSPGQTLIRKSALLAIGGFTQALAGADDFDLYVRLARNRPLLLVRRIALHYRLHQSNASRNHRQMLQAASSCLRHRLPEVPLRARWAAYRRAYRGLYDYVGKPILTGLRNQKDAPLRDIVRGGGQFLKAFWPGLIRDPKLATRILSDFWGQPKVTCDGNVTR